MLQYSLDTKCALIGQKFTVHFHVKSKKHYVPPCCKMALGNEENTLNAKNNYKGYNFLTL